MTWTTSEQAIDWLRQYAAIVLEGTTNNETIHIDLSTEGSRLACAEVYADFAFKVSKRLCELTAAQAKVWR